MSARAQSGRRESAAVMRVAAPNLAESVSGRRWSWAIMTPIIISSIIIDSPAASPLYGPLPRPDGGGAARFGRSARRLWPDFVSAMELGKWSLLLSWWFAMSRDRALEWVWQMAVACAGHSPT